MIGDRRAAEALQRALHDPADDPAGVGPATVGPATADEDGRLVDLARSLAAVGSTAPEGLAPRAAFRDALREQLLTEAATLADERAARGTALVGTSPRATTMIARLRLPAQGGQAQGGPARSRRSAATAPLGPRVLTLGRAYRVTAAAVVTVLVGGTAAAVASSSALPGEALYPVKRGIEQVRVATALSDTARGGTDLSLARARVDEAERLTTAGGADRSPGRLDDRTDDLVASALAEFDQRARSGIRTLVDEYADSGDASRLTQVETFLREVLPRLERLRDLLPPALRAVVDDIVVELGEAARDVAATAAVCGRSCTNLGIGEAAEVADTLLAAAAEEAPAADAPLPDTTPPGGVPAPATGTPAPSEPGTAAPAPAAPGSDVPAPGRTTAPGGRFGAGGGSAVVALPGVTASLGVPSIGVDGSGATVGVPLPGVTLGGATITLPSVVITVPLAPPTAPPAPPPPGCVVLIVSVCVQP